VKGPDKSEWVFNQAQLGDNGDESEKASYLGKGFAIGTKTASTRGVSRASYGIGPIMGRVNRRKLSPGMPWYRGEKGSMRR